METKIYFLPGNIVTLKQNIPNKPTMMVVKKVTKTLNTQTLKGDMFQGILCRWFTDNGFLQEAIFNTKDLLKL